MKQYDYSTFKCVKRDDIWLQQVNDVQVSVAVVVLSALLGIVCVGFLLLALYAVQLKKH